MLLTSNDVRINKESQKGNKAVFTFEPLPTTFGHTLGNTIRRVLLTSLEGAAATQIKISGVDHQFTTIDGVVEDVVQISLNLKQIRASLHGNEPVVAKISKKGAGPVLASDIQSSSELEILNKDHVICNLADKNSKFEAEIVFEKGVGYVSSEDRETNKIGVILLDAMFSPILSAEYKVEPTRFGRTIGLDKLSLEIQTDGSISPEDALKKAASILRSFFSRFSDGEDQKGSVNDVISEKSIQKDISPEDVSVDELPLPTRTINALKKQGILSLHELAGMTDEELADIKNLGEKSANEIKKLLSKEGLRK